MVGHDALFEVLTRFADTLTEHFEVGDVLYGLADNTVEVLGADAAGVSLVDQRGQLEFVSANTVLAAELEQVQQESQQGPCHQAFATGLTVVVNDITVHDEWPIYQRKAADVGLRAVLGIPLAVGARTLGALNVYSTHERTWSDDDLAAARVLANIATSFLLHASQLGEATRLNEQLQNALDSRIVIEQAKGILAGELGIDIDAGFRAMRGHARANEVSLRSVAEAVVGRGLRPNIVD